MDIKTYLTVNTTATARALARRAGTSHGYLRLMGYGVRRPSAEMALKLESASDGLITARELRPDVPWRDQVPTTPAALPTAP